MQSPLIHDLGEFSDANSETHLRRLEELLSSIDPLACGEPEFDALLQVFERFPDSDGFGIFWSIVHLLEACAGYEGALVRSVVRRPVEFNLLMVNRLVNAGVLEVRGQSLVALLASVQGSVLAGERAKEVARHFIEHHAARGGAGA